MTGRSRNNSIANLSEMKIKVIFLILQLIVNTLKMNNYYLKANRKIIFKKPLKISKIPMPFEETPINGCLWKSCL